MYPSSMLYKKHWPLFIVTGVLLLTTTIVSESKHERVLEAATSLLGRRLNELPGKCTELLAELLANRYVSDTLLFNCQIHTQGCAPKRAEPLAKAARKSPTALCWML